MRFFDMLTHYRRGVVLRSVDEELMNVVKAVKATRKAGEITIKLKFKPSKAGDNEIGIDADVIAKAPKATIPTAIFFADDEGGLHRTDPAQIDAFPEEEGGATSLDRRRLDAMSQAMAG